MSITVSIHIYSFCFPDFIIFDRVSMSRIMSLSISMNLSGY